MPLPMIHLAIAVEMATVDPRYCSPAFLLGSLAPDAIHMRPASTRDDKHLTHLTVPPATLTAEVAVRDLILRYMDEDSSLSLFAAGYGAHILADNRWQVQIFDDFFARIPDEIRHDRERMRGLYYSETDQLDFDRYHQADWRPAVWRKLAQADAPDFSPLLTADEIDQWRGRTLRWFTELKDEPGIQPEYLTETQIAAFIYETSVSIAQQFDTWCVMNSAS